MEELSDGFLGDLINQTSFVQDLLIITGTMLEKVQKNIHILLEKQRKKILKVASELTIKSKEWRKKAKI